MCPRYLYVFRYIIDIFTFYGKTIKEIYFLYHNINYTITQDLNPANHTYTPSKLGRVGYIYRWGEYELFFYLYRLGKAEYEKNPANAGFFTLFFVIDAVMPHVAINNAVFVRLAKNLRNYHMYIRMRAIRNIWHLILHVVGWEHWYN